MYCKLSCFVFVQTHNLHGSDTPHQLLQQSDVAVGKLADALSDKLLLVHGEAVGVSTLQQTAGDGSERANILGQSINQFNPGIICLTEH